MMAASLGEIESRAESVIKKLKKAGIAASILDGNSMVGGGSLPEQALPTKLVVVEPPYTVDDFTSRLRLSTPPLVGRIENGQFLIDMRTVMPPLDNLLVQVIESAASKAE
jgi:L-seryl-tRNA(Ser) seleniumtransferase